MIDNPPAASAVGSGSLRTTDVNRAILFQRGTSTLLKAEGFEYFRRGRDGDGLVSCGFAACFPDYHAQDRLGVVSILYENCALYTGFALLACGLKPRQASHRDGKIFKSTLEV